MTSHSVKTGSMALDADAMMTVERFSKWTPVGVIASHTKRPDVRHSWNNSSYLCHNDLRLHSRSRYDNLRSRLNDDRSRLLIYNLGLLINDLRLLLVDYLRLLLVHNWSLLLILRLLNILGLLLVLHRLLHGWLLGVAHRHLLLGILLLWLGVLRLLLLGILRLLLRVLVVHIL